MSDFSKGPCSAENDSEFVPFFLYNAAVVTLLSAKAMEPKNRILVNTLVFDFSLKNSFISPYLKFL